MYEAAAVLVLLAGAAAANSPTNATVEKMCIKRILTGNMPALSPDHHSGAPPALSNPGSAYGPAPPYRSKAKRNTVAQQLRD
jgi:hypothetical protein